MKKGNFKSFSEGYNQLQEAPHQKSFNQQPIQIQDEYVKLKSFIKDQKIIQDNEWRANLPYKLGYLLIIMIFFVFLIQGIYQSYQLLNQKKQLQIQKVQECLVKYEQKKCTIDKLEGQCKDLMHCMKSRNYQFGLVGFITQILTITVSMITQNILGPIMLAVTAFLLKIIQVMTEQKLRNDKKYF